MPEPTKLVTIEDRCNEQVIACLERALAQARAGQMTSVAIMALLKDGTVFNDHNGFDLDRLIGHLSIMQHDIITEMRPFDVPPADSET